jgi:hypothetical protein
MTCTQVIPQSGRSKVAQHFSAGIRFAMEDQPVKRATEGPKGSAVRFTDWDLSSHLIPPMNRWAISSRAINIPRLTNGASAMQVVGKLAKFLLNVFLLPRVYVSGK